MRSPAHTTTACMATESLELGQGRIGAGMEKEHVGRGHACSRYMGMPFLCLVECLNSQPMILVEKSLQIKKN